MESKIRSQPGADFFMDVAHLIHRMINPLMADTGRFPARRYFCAERAEFGQKERVFE